MLLRSDLEQVWTRLRAQALLTTFLLVMSLGLALLLSSVLQRLVSEPILSLAGTASRVSAEGNYSLRAERRSAEAARAEARYRELNRWAMEESSLLERHGIAPNDPDVLFRLAELKLAQRELPAARTYLERARVARPGDPRLRALDQRLHALAAQ